VAEPTPMSKQTIQFEQQEIDRLRREADEQGTSLSGVVRGHIRRSRRQQLLIRDLQQRILEAAG
jgi:hypothetical protein